MTERRNRSGAYSRRLIGPLTTLLLLLSVNRGMSDGSLNDIKFTGKVVDPSGAPIADARIKLTSPQILRSGALQLDATTTDAQGFFSLALPSSWRRTPMSLRQELFVSAAVDGRVGGVAFYRTSLPTPDGLVIRLDSTEKSNLAAVQIVTADGQPVVDAKVTVSALLVDGIHNGVDEDDARRTAANFGRSLESSEVGFIVPKSQVLVCDELQRIQGVTDDSGKVLLPVPASQLGGVQVESEQAGTQLVSVNPWARHEKREWPNRVRLRPTGQLVGRLVHKDVSLTRNQRFTLMSAFSDPGSGVDVSSSVEVVSDVNGQFAAEDMIVGSLFIRGELTMAPEYVIEWAPQEITSGDNEFEFPIVRTVRVSGRIVDSKSQQGVASADVLHTSAAGHKRFPCDQNGRFSLRSAPGELYLLVMSPTGYVLDHRIRQFDVPERESFALPDIELSPLSTIRGIVVDESAKPVVGADVRANWTGRDLRFGTERNQEKLAKSDVAGEFIMAHVDVREGVRLTATKDGRSRILTFAESEVSSPVTMTLVENDRQSIVGKVVDQQGREVANARLHVLHRTLDKNGHWSAVEDLTPVVSNQSATQSDGSFATMPVEPQGQYQLVVRGHRFAPLRTKWLDVTRPNGFDLGTLRIEQVDGIPGSVVDTHGRPVANANVQLRGVDSTSEVLSAADGSFEIAVEKATNLFLFVQHDKFHFYGRCLTRAPRRLEIQLVSAGLKSTSTPLSSHLPMSYADRCQVARQIALPFQQRLVESNGMDQDTYVQYARTVARAFPEFVPQLLEKNADLESQLKRMLRHEAFVHTPNPDTLAVEAYLESMGDGYAGLMAYRDVLKLPLDEEEKLRHLAEATLVARNVEQPDFRVIGFGIIGEYLLDLGYREDGEALLREAGKVAEGLPSAGWSGFAKGAFSEELCQVDVDLALALVNGLVTEHERTRHLGNIAHELAAIDSQKAEEVLNMIPPPQPNEFNRRDQYACQAIYRMARLDLERAKKIVASVDDPTMRAYSRGCMAVALAKENPQEARQLLGQAMDEIEQYEKLGERPPSIFGPPVAIAGMLTSFAEVVDPQESNEYFWRTLALMPRSGARIDHSTQAFRADAWTSLVILAARYQPDLAPVLWARLINEQKSAGPNVPISTHIGLLVDPDLVRSLDVDSPHAIRQIDQAVELLTRDDQAFWKIQNELARVWRIDLEDIDQ